MTTADALRLVNVDEAKAAIAEMCERGTATNWLLFEYEQERRSEVRFVGKGAGGLDELRALLPRDGLRFALFAVLTGTADAGADSAKYDAAKYVFLTWIGQDVPPGIAKARASTDGPQLADILRHEAHVSLVMAQATTPDELSYDDAAGKVMQVAPKYTQPSPRSSSAKAAKPATATAAAITFAASCKEGLEKVRAGTARWALLGYSAAQRGVVELVQVGTGGAAEVAPHFAEDKVLYAVFAIVHKPEGAVMPIKKVCVISMVGSQVPPLQKSRSAGHRGELLDFVLSVLPFHFQYQPQSAADITDQVLIDKACSIGK
jgi:hypothetical protein